MRREGCTRVSADFIENYVDPDHPFIHGMPWHRWIRLSYAERHRIDPENWPMASNEVLATMMTLEHPPAEIVNDTTTEATKARMAIEKLRSLPVVGNPGIALASDLLQHVKGEWERLDSRRKAITQPLLEAKRKIDALFSPATEALLEGEAILKRKIADAKNALERANYEAQIAAQQHLLQGDARGAALATQNLQPVEAPAGIQYREVWKWRITNAAVLPRDFLCPDTKKIEAHVKAHGQNHNIPGIAVERDTQIAAGRK